jgi:hypothetical protein
MKKNLKPKQSFPVGRIDGATSNSTLAVGVEAKASQYWTPARCQQHCNGRTSGLCYESCVGSRWF